jgi:hypothetical protein
MPLIAGTEYRELIEVTTGAEVRKDAGDPHPGTLLHFALALNPDSRPVKEAAGFLSRMAPGARAGVHPLSWLGQSISIYADQDPFWEELAGAAEAKKFLEAEFHRLPVALNVEVKSALGLTAFLAGARGFVDQSAPGLTFWENLEHRGQPYVRISTSPGARGRAGSLEKVAVFYAATADALTVSLNEDVLKRSLERQAARKAGGAEAEKLCGGMRPWLGTSAGLQVDRKFLGPVLALLALDGEDYREKVRALSWSNLPILNEWKRRFPGRDPVEVHETYWQRKLLCPGGGKYVWNEKYGTMESTVYGHPGEPKLPSGDASPFFDFAAGSFGLTFENQGLRARVELERAGPAR